MIIYNLKKCVKCVVVFKDKDGYNAVRNQPYLIMLPKGESTYVPSKDVRLKEGQIKYLLTQPNPMFHPIMKLIYETVTDKFSETELDLSAVRPLKKDGIHHYWRCISRLDHKDKRPSGKTGYTCCAYKV